MHVDDILSEKIPRHIPTPNMIYILLWLTYFVRKSLLGRFPKDRKINIRIFDNILTYPINDKTYMLDDTFTKDEQYRVNKTSQELHVHCMIANGVKCISWYPKSNELKQNVKKFIDRYKESTVFLIEDLINENVYYIYFMVHDMVYKIDSTLEVTCMNTDDIYNLLPDEKEFYFSAFSNHCLLMVGNGIFI
jgi:hypothetical protein